MSEKLYFGAGPSVLPDEVLSNSSAACLEYVNGLSILELGHRTPEFIAIVDETKSLINELCGLNQEYEILFIQGGGRMQFSMIPMNFLTPTKTAGYIDSGHWANDAMHTAEYYGQVKMLASTKALNYQYLPLFPTEKEEGLEYLHITTNNTIYGTQFKDIPNSNQPLIADMSSDILSMPRNYKQFDLFYAVAQKNLGAAGVTMVAIKKSFLEKANTALPSILNFKKIAQSNSILNTPPVFSIYTVLLTLRWMKKKSLNSLYSENKSKANLLYYALENSPSFDLIVSKKEDRSLMNIVFRAKDTSIENKFKEFAKKNLILGINGHQSVGGFRVSLYNAISVKTVETLVEKIKEFDKNI